MNLLLERFSKKEWPYKQTELQCYAIVIYPKAGENICHGKYITENICIFLFNVWPYTR